MATQKSTSHARSISLPSRSHPLEASLEDQLSRLRSSSGAEPSSSSSSSSLCQSLFGIRELYEDMHDMIRLPHNQQALSRQHGAELEEVLEGSLSLLDFCGSTADLLADMKASVLELQSSLRRRSLDISTYKVSRRKISKSSTNLKKKIERACVLEKEINNSTVRTLREAQGMSLSTLRSVIGYISGSKQQHGWSMVGKLVGSKRVVPGNANEMDKINSTLFALEAKKSGSIEAKAVQDLLRQLEGLEMGIQEIELGLELVSRALVKTRVSLLNVLNN